MFLIKKNSADEQSKCAYFRSFSFSFTSLHIKSIKIGSKHKLNELLSWIANADTHTTNNNKQLLIWNLISLHFDITAVVAQKKMIKLPL